MGDAASWTDRFEGRACANCGLRTGDLFRVVYSYPPPKPGSFWNPEGKVGWASRTRASCVDRESCEARRRKREERSRTRSTTLVLAEPRAPAAPRGTCRWCGEPLTGANPGARNYCYEEREGRDCRGDFDRSRCYGARDLVEKRGDPSCVDCGSDGAWEADHDLALEDGGEHVPENIVRRCVPCHRAKTTQENAYRAARARREREESDAQEQLAV